MTFSMSVLFFPHWQVTERAGTLDSMQLPWESHFPGGRGTAGKLHAAGMLQGFLLRRQWLLSFSAWVLYQ